MNIATDATGLVLMYSEVGNPTPPAGGAFYVVDDALFLAAMGKPNGGVRYDGQNFTVLPVTQPVIVQLTVDQKLASIGLTIIDIQGAIVEAQTKSPVAIPDPNTAPVAQQASI